jgi:hypothetical protein
LSAARGRRWTLAGTIAVPVLICAGVLTFCVGPAGYYNRKYAPAPGPVTLADHPGPILPEVQTEPHTCGFHSLSAVYRAYGLEPASLNLRFRLGTDARLNLLAPESTGTVHPDILRVLEQDGFAPRVVNPLDLDAALAHHLDSGHPALVLTKVNSWHWVVAASRRDGRLLICDSLRPQPYEVDEAGYLRDSVFGLILIRPRGQE